MITDFNSVPLDETWEVVNGAPQTSIIDCMRLRLVGKPPHGDGVGFTFTDGSSLYPRIDGVCIGNRRRDLMLISASYGDARYLIDYDAHGRSGAGGRIRKDYAPPVIEPGTVTLLSVPDREELFDALKLRLLVNTVRFLPETLNGHHEKMSVEAVSCIHPNFEGSWLFEGTLMFTKKRARVWCFTNHCAGVMKIFD